MTVDRLEASVFRFRDKNTPRAAAHRTGTFETFDHALSLTLQITRLNRAIAKVENFRLHLVTPLGKGPAAE
jgi:hypothetical protein